MLKAMKLQAGSLVAGSSRKARAVACRKPTSVAITTSKASGSLVSTPPSVDESYQNEMALRLYHI